VVRFVLGMGIGSERRGGMGGGLRLGAGVGR